MVDENKGTEEEYEFKDYDMEPHEGGAYDEPQLVLEDQEKTKSPILRNSLIVLGGIIALLLGYNLFSGWFYQKEPVKTEIVQKPISKPVIVAEPKPVVTQTIDLSQDSLKKVDEQIQALEASQQTLRTEVATLNDQLTGISSTISALSKQIESLNVTIVTLTEKVNEDSLKIADLIERKKTRKVRKIKTIVVPRVYYHIQAIIPGRAWLIASNGSTLTVREGSSVPGYGIVKLIDATQGRVLMRSGQVIEFSQQDS